MAFSNDVRNPHRDSGKLYGRDSSAGQKPETVYAGTYQRVIPDEGRL